MKHDPGKKHSRRSIRLQGHDYAQAGAYFITICARDRKCLFGDVANGEMRLSVFGRIATECWNEVPHHFAGVALDAFVVMPNHVHGILLNTDNGRIRPVRARHAVPLQPNMESFGRPVSGSIPTIMRSFKSAVTKRVNEMRTTPGLAVWQRNYYEHVIRNAQELTRVREYIAHNPLQWESDRENPLTGAREAEKFPWEE